MERFKEALDKIGTPYEDNPEETYDTDDLDIYENSVNVNTSIEFLQIGDSFGGFGIVKQPVDKEGFMITEDDYGRVITIKVLNTNFKPSLYTQMTY